MAVEDDTLDPVGDPDNEIEEVDVEEVDALEGDEDGDEEETPGAADGDGEEASPPGRPEGSQDVRQPSRAERRIQTALREAKEAKERADRLERMIAEQANRQPTETATQRAERLAMMEPEERIRYEVNETTAELRNELARIRFESQDSADRTAFEGLCARNPVASKLRDQVEDYLAQMRRSGTNAPRETVLRYVIGDRALANAGRATTKARKSAEGNIARHTARVASPRGDVGASGRAPASEREARRKRLEDMPI